MRAMCTTHDTLGPIAATACSHGRKTRFEAALVKELLETRRDGFDTALVWKGRVQVARSLPLAMKLFENVTICQLSRDLRQPPMRVKSPEELTLC